MKIRLLPFFRNLESVKVLFCYYIYDVFAEIGFKNDVILFFYIYGLIFRRVYAILFKKIACLRVCILFFC